MNKKLVIFTVLGFLIFITPTFAENPHFCQYSFESNQILSVKESNMEKKTNRVSEKEVWVTAYSSTPEETDSTPFETAMMTNVRDGIVAVNFLPFGTKIKIPKLFGDKIFIVEDRMHERKKNFVDVWMPSKEAAKEFGIVKTNIVIVEYPSVAISR